MINDYPYTNMVYQNIDWLIKEVNALKNEGKTPEETSEKVSKSIFAQGGFVNSYPYTNMVYQNIDWLIKAVYDVTSRVDSAETDISEIKKELEKLAQDDLELQEQIKEFNNLLSKKVDKTSEEYRVYGTEDSGSQRLYTIDSPNSTNFGNIPQRTSYGNLLATNDEFEMEFYGNYPLINKGYANANYVHTVKENYKVYGTDSQGRQTTYIQTTNNDRYTIPFRDANASIKVGEEITGDLYVTHKRYVDEKATDTLLEAQAYADTHGGGGWETVAEYIAEEDTTIPVVAYNPKNKDITGLKVTVYADSSEDVEAEVYADTVEVKMTDAQGTGETVASISNCLPRVFSKSVPTTDLITLGNTYYADADGNTLPANLITRQSLGKSVMTNPSNIISGGTSKLTSADVEFTLNSYIPNTSVSVYRAQNVTYEGISAIRPSRTQSGTLPPDSTASTHWEYIEDNTPLVTPESKKYLDKVVDQQAIHPYSLAGTAMTYTISYGQKTVLDDEMFFYDFTVTGAGHTYNFRWYWATGNNAQYAHLFCTSTDCPEDLAFQIDEITLTDYTPTQVSATGYYSADNPNRVLYVDGDGKVYANDNDITESVLSFSAETPTDYKGIFTAEVSVYGSNAVCTRIEGTGSNFTNFNDQVAITNSGSRFACSAKGYITLSLNESNTLYKGSKLRIESIATREAD